MYDKRNTSPCAFRSTSLLFLTEYLICCIGTCWKDPTNYTGKLNVAISGHYCLNWTEDSPGNYDSYHEDSQYPDRSVEDASNYCRSPSGYPALWCFVQGGSYDFCGSPPCFGMNIGLWDLLHYWHIRDCVLIFHKKAIFADRKLPS